MRKQRMLMVGFLVLTCAARAARANDWSELGRDSAESHDTLEVSSPAFAAAWTYSLGSGPIIATPVGAGGRIIVAGSDGAVAAVNAVDGSTVWKRSLSDGVRATPAIWNDRVAIPTMGGAFYSLALTDGSIEWQRAFGGQNYSSPVVVARSSATGADTLLVATGFPGQDLWRVDALTGETVWQTAKGAIPALVYSSAAVVGSRAVIGMNGGRFQSFDLQTGVAGWKLDASGPVYLSSPLVVGNRVYTFPADQGVHLYAVDADTGAAVTGFPVAIPDPAPVAGTQPFGQGPAVSSPTSVGGLVVVQLRRQDMVSSGRTYQVFMREWVVAIDPASAQVRWQYPLANVTAPNTNGVPELGLCATPAGFSGPTGSFVAVSSSITGRVVVLDVQTGKEAWSAALSAPGRSSPVFSNGQLFVATDDGILNAFSSASNRAPTPPSEIGPTALTAFSSAGNQVTWRAGTDPEAGALSYVVRVEEEGAPATRVETVVAQGLTQVTLSLEPDTTYLVAVRSRDAQGALSPWSSEQRVSIGAAAPVAAVAPSDVVSPPSASTPETAVTPPLVDPPVAESTPATPPACGSSTAATPPSPPPTPASPPSVPPVATEAPASASSTEAQTGSVSGSSPADSAPVAIQASGDGANAPSTAAPAAVRHDLGAIAHEDDTVLPSVSTMSDSGLAPRGGCSIAEGRGGDTMLGLWLAALVLGARRRRSTRGEKA